VRAILFYQGESDGANASAHHDGFVTLHEGWREDFPGVERFYLTQVRTGCGSPTIELRDGQRRLADTLEDLSVMSTTGLDAHDGCHYAYEGGYEDLAARFHGMVSRDLYGAPAAPNLDPPNVGRVFLSDGRLVVETRDPTDQLELRGDTSADFVVAGADVVVTSVAVDGNVLTLTLSGDASTATTLSYMGHARAGAWVVNAQSVGLLTFQVPIEAP
jgi:hypothetical protein